MKKKAPIPKEAFNRLLAKTIAYLESPEGQKELSEAFARGRETARMIRENARIDPAKMQMPFGPRRGRWEIP